MYYELVTDDRTESLRERTRRAVQEELLAAAQALIVEHGYDAVTIDQIAAAVGMSQRSFFRYFPSKEALVIGKLEPIGDELIDALEGRPRDEPIWVSLRRMFDPLTDAPPDPVRDAESEALQRIIAANPTLRAGYLAQLDRLQRRAVTVLQNRPGANSWDRPTLRVAVGAAFAAFQNTFLYRTEQPDQSVAEALDHAMGSLTQVVRSVGTPARKMS